LIRGCPLALLKKRRRAGVGSISPRSSTATMWKVTCFETSDSRSIVKMNTESVFAVHPTNPSDSVTVVMSSAGLKRRSSSSSVGNSSSRTVVSVIA